MKDGPVQPVVSTKSRTRTKFDLLLRNALEERKPDSSLEIIELEKGNETKKSKKKPKKCQGDHGVINPGFEDGNNFELKQIQRTINGSRKSKKIDVDGQSTNLGHTGGLETEIKNDETQERTADGESGPIARRRIKKKKGERRKSKNSDVNDLETSTNNDDPTIAKQLHHRPLPEQLATDSYNDKLEIPAITDPKVPKVQKQKKSSPKRTTDLSSHSSEVPNVADTVEANGETNIVDHFSSSAKDELCGTVQSELHSVEQEPRRNTLEASDRIMGIKIHKVDRLKVNLTIKHPLVRIHVVDGITGTYFNKSKRIDCAATSTDSKENISVDFLQPAMTQPFDIKTKKSFIPVWEEEILFSANFDVLTERDSNVIIFFEIMDFLSMSRAQNQYQKLGSDSGWYRIAWAFLKLVGSNGSLNTNCKAQLQLFHFPKQPLRPEPRVVDLYQYWSTTAREPYPSTLYVTVCPVSTPSSISHRPTSGQVNHHERNPGPSATTDGDVMDTTCRTNGETSGRSSPKSSPAPHWSRLPGQSCKIPNTPYLNFPMTSQRGCFAVSFSHNGRLCACTCHKETSVEILIFKVPCADLLVKLSGHNGLVYDLQFSIGDKWLISPSSDGSARIWKMEGKTSGCVQILPHPSYVYSASFHPHTPSVVATGCYDTVVRVWKVDSGTTKYGQLLQELEGHRSRVNTLCFDKDGIKLFSGDGVGTIRQWNSHVSNHPAREGVTQGWTLCREIKIPELHDISITNFLLHPTLNRLFVQSLDCAIRAMDTDSLQIIQEYRSFLNVHEHIRGCITPCGNFVFSGSEDHCVHVWNTFSGVQMTVYDDLPFGKTVHCVAYHPLDHIVAFCSYGIGCPLIFYKYNPTVTHKNVSVVQPADLISTTKMSSNKLPPSLSTSGILHPLVASTPRQKMPLALSTCSEFNFSGTVNSATCLEKIMRKLDSVLETSALMTKKNCSRGGPPMGDLSDYGNESLVQSDYDASNLSLEVSRIQGGREHSFRERNDISKEVSAMITRSGELAFMSASEESIDKLPLSATKRERRRQKTRYDFDED